MSDLPFEILLLIFQYLPVPIIVCKDSKFWYTILKFDIILPFAIKFKEYTNLKELKIPYHTELTDEILRCLKKLIYLDVGNGRKITDTGLGYLTNLKFLKLPYNKNITDRGIEKLTRLEYLNIGHSRNITDNGLGFLVNLVSVILPCNKDITDNGLKYIPNIQHLNLLRNKNITDKGIEYLVSSTDIKTYAINYTYYNYVNVTDPKHI